jgi:hypothetical protein
VSAIRLALRRAAQRREPATVLAVLRIALGLCLLWTLALMLGGSAVDVLWRSPSNGGLLPVQRSHWLFWLLPSDEGSALWLLFTVTGIGALAATLGLGGRVVLLVTQQCFVALRSLNPEVQGGYDTLLATGFLLLGCSGCTQTLAVDCWLRQRTWTSAKLCFAWPRYALIVQLLLMYCLSGLQKLGLPWTPLGDYSALYYVLTDPTWIRVDWGDLRAFSLPLAVGTAITWHWEQLSPLLLLHYYYRATPEHAGWLRRTCLRFDARLPFALTGFALHLGILALLDVGPFSLVALCYYVCLWSPAEWRALLSNFSFRTLRAATGLPAHLRR